MSTITNWNGGAVARALHAVGSYLGVGMLTAVQTTADDNAGAVTFTFPNMAIIRGFIIQTYISDVLTARDYAITKSGNALTITDGSSDKLTIAHVTQVLVWGTPKV